jgi:hypothetical protein
MLSKYPILIAALTALIITTAEVANTANQFDTAGVPYVAILQLFLCLTAFLFVPFTLIEVVVKLVRKLL